MPDDLSDAQVRALKAIDKGSKHADEGGFVCRIVLDDKPSTEQLEKLRLTGFVEYMDVGAADILVKLTPAGAKAIAPKSTSKSE